MAWKTQDTIGNDISPGHDSGNTWILIDVLGLFRGETSSNSICDVRVSYENHLTGFAAEGSRLTGQVIRLAEYEKSIKKVRCISIVAAHFLYAQPVCSRSG